MRPVTFGYWAPQEHYAPLTLLDRVVRAEQHGFTSCCSSDHFHPWRHTDGHAGHTWIWLAAAAARTQRMEFGTAVTTSIYRYHPAIIAQAFATLDHLCPHRVFLGLGTGEAMNEVPLGFTWPGFKHRLGHLRESIQIMRQLWTGQFVRHAGSYYQLRDAKLYTLPTRPIPIYVAAHGPQSARFVGEVADGLVATPKPDATHFTQEIFPALQAGAEAAGRDWRTLDRLMELKISYAPDYDTALAACRFWKATSVTGILDAPVYDPRELERLGDAQITDAEIARKWMIRTHIDDFIGIAEEYLRLGFNRLYFHSSSPDEDGVMAALGRRVLPYLKEQYPALA